MKTISIGAVARATGAKAQTIRYYEEIGLMPTVRRTPGGHRLYSEQDIQRLNFIRRTRELGFTINDVRELLTLIDGETYACDEVKALTLAHAKSVRARIDVLSRLEGVLQAMTAQCDGGELPRCSIIESLMEDSVTAPIRD